MGVTGEKSHVDTDLHYLSLLGFGDIEAIIFFKLLKQASYSCKILCWVLFEKVLMHVCFSIHFLSFYVPVKFIITQGDPFFQVVMFCAL